MSAVVTLERVQDGVATVRMVDAARRNALTEALVADLVATFGAAVADPEVRVVVVCGLPGVFCSGADREMLSDLQRGQRDPADLLLPRLFLDAAVPVIAAMEGHAVGGGLALGLAADVSVAARESRYGCSFMNMGFTPGMGTTALLEHAMTPALAHELLYTGELRRGAALVGRAFNAVLPRDEVEPHAHALAMRMAEKPAVSLRLLKRSLSLPRRRAFESARSLETLMHQVSFRQPDVARRIEDYLHD